MCDRKTWGKRKVQVRVSLTKGRFDGTWFRVAREEKTEIT